LDLFPSIDTRKVIRLTMVKGWNMKSPEKYADMIRRAEPDYIEVKAYEWVGESQKRLPRWAMPCMEDRVLRHGALKTDRIRDRRKI